MVGHLIADLVGAGDFAQCGEQELDEGGGVPGFVTSGEDGVLVCLLIADGRGDGVGRCERDGHQCSGDSAMVSWENLWSLALRSIEEPRNCGDDFDRVGDRGPEGKGV